MGGKNDAPPPPDYSGLIAINEKTANMAMKLARDQFDWAKQTYNDNKDLMLKTGQSFLSTMENSRKAFEEDRARYKSQYQPMEDELIRDARTYDTPERRDQEVGAAQANVAQQFDAARTNAQKQLELFGVNPSSTRFGGLDLGARLAQATTQAAAGTTAARNVEDKGRALRAAAVDIGRGYPNSYLAAAQIGNQSAGGAQQGANQTLQTGAQAMGTGPQWLQGGNQALGNWGDILNNQYNAQLGQYNANQSSGWGQVLGMVGGMAMKRFGFDEGGAVPPEASPSGGGQQDDVPVAVSVGEFVVPRETVSWLGEKHFHKLIEKTKEERSESQAVPADPAPAPPPPPPPEESVPGYAQGGMVQQPRGEYPTWPGNPRSGRMGVFPGRGGGLTPLPRGEYPTYPGGGRFTPLPRGEYPTYPGRGGGRPGRGVRVPIDPSTYPVDPYEIPGRGVRVPIDPSTYPVDPYEIPGRGVRVPIDPSTYPVDPYEIPGRGVRVPIDPSTYPSQAVPVR